MQFLRIMTQVHLHNRRILIQCEQLTAVHMCLLLQSAYRIADPVTYARDVSSVRETHTHTHTHTH